MNLVADFGGVVDANNLLSDGFGLLFVAEKIEDIESRIASFCAVLKFLRQDGCNLRIFFVYFFFYFFRLECYNLQFRPLLPTVCQYLLELFFVNQYFQYFSNEFC